MEFLNKHLTGFTLFQVKKGTSSPKDWRLFSAGLHGLVIEHSLELDDDADEDEDEDGDGYSKTVRRSWPVTSGAVWCMKFNEVGEQQQQKKSCNFNLQNLQKISK